MSYSLNVRTSLLATGRFLAIIPASVLRFGAARGALKVVPCALPPAVQPVAVTTLMNRTLSPTAKLFIECARAIAQSSHKPNGIKRKAQRQRSNARLAAF
jgi:DNA-binding transcriptional LysR family regulator